MKQIFDVALRPIKPPCGKDCPGRAAGCTVQCCSWALYVSIRNYIYDVNLKQRHKMELNDGASRCAAKNRR